MYKAAESETMLNLHASVLAGTGLSFRVHYWGVVPQLFDNPVHKHSFFEICYVLDGEGSYMDEGIVHRLRKGTLFCSRPGAVHQIRTEKGLYLLYVAFEVDEAGTSAAHSELYRALTAKAEICVDDGDVTPTALLWKSLLIPENEERAMPAEALPALAHSLLHSFAGLFGQQTKVSEAKQSRANALLRQAKLFVRDNLAEPLSLKTVASYLNLSERHLSRLFAEGIHESFSGFVRSERVRQAAHMLQTTASPIKEIAEATGFGSVHYFTRAFTIVKGMPPGQFRLLAEGGSRSLSGQKDKDKRLTASSDAVRLPRR
ncbi:helix-turn-helix domain-containing protein [Paenibacillus sp. MBLB4367]|uniref:helix-turn-helix domain-containing protein n=1 Tax=Paenibacillus sp. MBLB4367 TaxID=3384767 RepID=UPI003907FD29